jgi:hypothetical protein
MNHVFVKRGLSETSKSSSASLVEGKCSAYASSPSDAETIIYTDSEILTFGSLNLSAKNRSPQALDVLAKLPYALPGLIGGPKMGKGGKSGKSKGRGKGHLDYIPNVKDGTNWSVYSGLQPATRLLSSISNEPFNTVQLIEFGNLVNTSVSVPTFAGYSFVASGIGQIASFQAIFDQYKVRLIEAWITPQQSTSVASGAGSRFASVIDYDDVTALSSVQAAYNYEDCVETTLEQGHYRRFVPHIAVAAYSGAFTSFCNVTAPWVDMASTSVQHYGLKIACETSVAVTPMWLTVRVHLSFRNVR